MNLTKLKTKPYHRSIKNLSALALGSFLIFAGLGESYAQPSSGLSACGLPPSIDINSDLIPDTVFNYLPDEFLVPHDGWGSFTSSKTNDFYGIDVEYVSPESFDLQDVGDVMSALSLSDALGAGPIDLGRSTFTNPPPLELDTTPVIERYDIVTVCEPLPGQILGFGERSGEAGQIIEGHNGTPISITTVQYSPQGSILSMSPAPLGSPALTEEERFVQSSIQNTVMLLVSLERENQIKVKPCTGTLLPNGKVLTALHCGQWGPRTKFVCSEVKSVLARSAYGTEIPLVFPTQLPCSGVDLDYWLIDVDMSNFSLYDSNFYIQGLREPVADENLFIVNYQYSYNKETNTATMTQYYQKDECTVKKPRREGRPTQFVHLCDTLGGSSGSLLFGRGDFNLIGIHVSTSTEEKENYALRIEEVQRDLSERFDLRSLLQEASN